MDESSAGKFEFPVWAGEGARPSRSLEQGSLALLLAGFSVLTLVASLFGSWTSFGVLVFLGPVALAAALYLAPSDPGSTAGRATQQKTHCRRFRRSPSTARLPCSHADQATLRIVEGEGLEIAAPDTEGMYPIKPWEPGICTDRADQGYHRTLSGAGVSRRPQVRLFESTACTGHHDSR